MCFHPDYVFSSVLCVFIRIMCFHLDYVFSSDLCVFIRIMCFHPDYVQYQISEYFFVLLAISVSTIEIKSEIAGSKFCIPTQRNTEIIT
jgi:hypothetical protein